MMPIGPLMIEHRLIERMVKQMAEELTRIEGNMDVNLGFLAEAIDFIRTYADRCHHGKEEGVLFRDLESKPLSQEDKKVMGELVEEHRYARQVVRRLDEAKDQYARMQRKGFQDIVICLRELVDFYPVHIEKEDKHFFLPCMNYFAREEKDAMLREFWDFDKNLIHEKYKKIVEAYKK
jgi:hemerythrin-like domain-containing protein